MGQTTPITPPTWTAADFLTWRHRMTFSQAEAAERLGLSKRQIQHYESGKTPVSGPVALACCFLEIAHAIAPQPAADPSDRT